MVRNKSDQFLFRMTPELKKALQKAANKDSRSMASLIEKLIKDHISKEGISWKDE